MLHEVGWCWIKFENGDIFVATFLDLARCFAFWPAPSQHLTTRSNNVARCCVEMLLAFGRALRALNISQKWLASPLHSYREFHLIVTYFRDFHKIAKLNTRENVFLTFLTYIFWANREN